MKGAAEEQIIRLVPAAREPTPKTDAPRSVFDLARNRRDEPIRVFDGELPPRFYRRSIFAIAYDDLGQPGKITELLEPRAKSFKRWARENNKPLEWRLVAPGCWAFKRPSRKIKP